MTTNSNASGILTVRHKNNEEKKIEIHKFLEMFSLNCSNLEMHRLIYGQYMPYNNDTGIVPRFNRFVNVSVERTSHKLWPLILKAILKLFGIFRTKLDMSNYSWKMSEFETFELNIRENLKKDKFFERKNKSSEII